MSLNPRSAAFRLLTAGYDFYLIEGLWDRLAKSTGFTFEHVLHPSVRAEEAMRRRRQDVHWLRDDIRAELPPPDLEFLASLESAGVPTIHNMIMCDDILRRLEYSDALRYASHIAQRMKKIFLQSQPSVIVSGFDAFHSSIAFAVARSLRVPFFAISYTSMPTGLTGFCTGMNTATCVSVQPVPEEQVRALAEETLREFESHRLIAPTIVTENNLATIVGRLPARLHSFVRAVYRAATLRFDRFTQPPIGRSVRAYIRKRWNLLRLPGDWFIENPPDGPFLFLGLHMQPEMAIDVWAPFYSDQFAVVESIARAMPPTHQFLVKLHKIDADNYSRRQLDRLRRLPGVRLVSPFASSRAFIEKAALVLSIQGTITLEAAMLGRPVLAFGETKYAEMPSVTMVKRVTDLPEQVREKLAETPPTREEIIRGLMGYLGSYAPGIYNDWDVLPSDEGICRMSELFESLRAYLGASNGAPV